MSEEVNYQNQFLQQYAPFFDERVNNIKDSVGTGRGRNHGKPGMEQLVNIVVGLQRDVKRIKKLQSKQGVIDFVNEKGVDSKGKRWRYSVEDPNRDGIPDYFVYDRDNNLKYVNGYTTTESDWAYRQNYMDDRYVDKKAGNEPTWHSMKEYIHDVYRPQYNDADHQTISNYAVDNEAFDNKLKARGLTPKKPRNLTPMQAFTKYLTTPAINYFVEKFNIPRNAINFIKINSHLWNNVVVGPVLSGIGVDLGDTERIKAIKNDKKFKNLMKQVVADLINSTEDAFVNLIKTIGQHCSLSPEQLNAIPNDFNSLSSEMNAAKQAIMQRKGLNPV